MAQSVIRRVVLSFIATAIGLIVALVLAEIVFRFLPVNTGLRVQPVNAANPVQRFQPDSDYVFSRGGNFSIVNRGHVNNDGFVSDWDYDPNGSGPLLGIIGDSFVEALMVPFPDTLTGRLGDALRGRMRVYSFAASGSPLSQYLVYAGYARDTYHPDLLAVVVIGNDYDESMIEYKSAPAFHYFKAGSDGQLELTRVDYEPTFLRRLLRNSSLLRYLITNAHVDQLLSGVVPWSITDPEFTPRGRSDPASAHVVTSRRAVDEFLKRLPEAAGLPADRIMLIIDGIRPELYRSERLAEAEGSYLDLMRDYLIEEAGKAGFAVRDMQPVFIAHHAREGKPFEFATDGHWNALGHELAARAVLDWPAMRDVLDNGN